MPIQDEDRAERVSRLQELVENDKVELPPLDQPAFTTLLAQLERRQRATSRLKIVALVVAALLLAWLFYAKLS